MKYSYKVLCVVTAVLVMLTQFGCEEETSSSGGGSDIQTLDPVETGVTPSSGGYSINVKGSLQVISATSARYSYDGYASYIIPIHNGGISFSNGNYYWILNGEKFQMLDESGNAYPTDDFAIWIQWTSPNHCEGKFWNSTDSAISFSGHR